MSHIDEGTLHAYLDGALDTLPAAEAERVRGHLATCDTCQLRLDEERAVREEAAAILGGVTLELDDLPTFEEVRARARGTTDVATAGHRLRQVAWAASLVLALGTGWMLRGGIPQPTGRVDAAQDAARPTEAARPEAAPAPSEGVAPEADSPERSVLAGAAQEPLGAGEQEEASSRSGEPSGAPSANLRDALTAAAEATFAKASPDMDMRVTAEPAGDVAAAAGRRREAPATRLTVPPPGTGSELAAGARTFVATSEEVRPALAQARSTIPERVDALAPARGSLVVPGLAVLSVAWFEEPGLVGAVRVLQLMENGDTLELVHLPVGVDPALLPPGGEGRTQLLSARDGGWLVARARASAAVLSDLLRTLDIRD